MSNYGFELILDIHDADPSKFNRKDTRLFFKELCDLIGMQREDLHFWDYEGQPDEYTLAPDHLKGVSAIQFIKTSNITIHTLDVLKKIFINIFSCKRFDPDIARKFASDYFSGKVVQSHFMERL